MQLVYFLFLPSALLSNQLLSYAAHESTPSDTGTGIVDWKAWLNMWLVVGCFALSARWLEKSQRQYLDGIVVRDQGGAIAQSVWMLRHRDSLLLWLWCLLQPICLVASGWAQWTQRMTASPGLQSLNIVLSLTPCIFFLLLVEIIRVSRTKRHGHADSSIVSKLAHYRAEMTRMIMNTWFLPFALPIAISVIADIAARIEIVGPNHGLFGTVACTLTTSLLITILLPHVFTRLVGAEPVDATVLAIVENAWRLGSRTVPRILLWPTGCRMANAAVVGLFGFGRKLLLTDALLQRLDDRELTMVVLHELAHCVRFHAWIRMIPTLVVILLLLCSMTLLSGVWLSLSCAALFLLFIVSLIGVCWWTEFDADRVAIEMAVCTGEVSDRASLLRSRASDLCEALRKIYGVSNMQRRSWMHPSCVQRVEAIRTLSQSASRFCDSIEPQRCNG